MRATLSLLLAIALSGPATAAADEFCEPSGTDCRARLLAYIGRETVRIDAGMEEIADSVIADALIARFKAGVPVRALIEPRRTPVEPLNATMLAKLKSAGIPMRYKPAGGFLHWKMMIFAGQFTVEFGAPQFTKSYLVPVEPFVNFTQDPIVFSTNTAIVNSFQRKFDDAWVDTVNFAQYANSPTVQRAYPLYAVSTLLNFVPAQNFLTRVKPHYDAETSGLDVIIYKVTEPGHADAMIRAVKRGVPVRLITEPNRYRNRENVWHAYNIDRMHAAGVQVRERAHSGFLHQKTALLLSQGRTIFGSSNWTEGSNQLQYEHNIITTDRGYFDFFRSVFLRKWNSATETRSFVPLPPTAPVNLAPANATGGYTATVVLSWQPGPWAHRADLYLSSSSSPTLYLKDVAVGPSTIKKVTASGLLPGTTYYWKVISKTMAGKTATGPIWSFNTAS
jgi:phosphatidylserine/phosphatidylglycerophosphate/cardiolipin synthase-like enzyme